LIAFLIVITIALVFECIHRIDKHVERNIRPGRKDHQAATLWKNCHCEAGWKMSSRLPW